METQNHSDIPVIDLKPIELDVAEGSQPPIPTPPAPQAPLPGKTFISYVYVKGGSKKERHGRVFLGGVIDLFSQDQVERAEQAIAQHITNSGEGPVDGVCILNWRRLVA